MDVPGGATVVARVEAAEMGTLAPGDDVAVTWASGDGILVLDD